MFNTYEDAYNSMKRWLNWALGFDSDNWDEQVSNDIYESVDYNLAKTSAWANLKSNYDWIIEELEVGNE